MWFILQTIGTSKNFSAHIHGGISGSLAGRYRRVIVCKKRLFWHGGTKLYKHNGRNDHEFML